MACVSVYVGGEVCERWENHLTLIFDRIGTSKVIQSNLHLCPFGILTVSKIVFCMPVVYCMVGSRVALTLNLMVLMTTASG
jgi:hypothetical protein